MSKKGLDDPVWGKRNNLNAEKNIENLLVLWSKKSLQIVFIQHMSTSANSPLYPGKEGNNYKDLVAFKKRKDFP